MTRVHIEMLENWKSQSLGRKILAVTILALVVFAYLPSLQFDYARDDQWRAFRYTEQNASPYERFKDCARSVNSYYITSGRPLVWVSECVEHAFVRKIEDFKYFRFFSLAVVIVTVLYLGSVIAPFSGGLIGGMTVAAIWTFSPGYAFMYLQGWEAFMVLLAGILGISSYSFYLQAIKCGKISWLRLFISSILFILACYMYAACAFIVIPLIWMNYSELFHVGMRKSLKSLFTSLVFYGILSLIYYYSVKLQVYVLKYFTGYALDLGKYNVNIASFDILLNKLALLINVFKDMPPWNFQLFNGVSIFIISAFCIILVVQSQKNNSITNIFKTISMIFLTLLVTCLMIIFSVSPWFFSGMPDVGYHQIISIFLFPIFSTVFLLNWIFSLMYKLEYSKTAFALVIIFLLPITIVQNSLVIIDIGARRGEFEFVRNSIDNTSQNNESKRNRFILFIIPKSGSKLAGIDDMFIQKSSPYGLLSLPLDPLIHEQMLRSVLSEENQTRKIKNCGYYTQGCVASMLAAYPDDIVMAYIHDDNFRQCNLVKSPVPPVVINISKLTSHPVNPQIEVTDDAPVITASSTMEPYGPGTLFSAQPPAWHAEPNPSYPQSLKIDFKKPKSMSSVSFQAQAPYLIFRSPKSVNFKISDDGQKWNIIAHADNLCTPNDSTDDLWRPNDSKGWHKFLLPENTRARYLEVEILSNCGDPGILTLRGLKVD